MTIPLPAFAHPLLVADIGGTNARFSIVAVEGEAPVTLCRVLTASFPSAQAAIGHAIAQAGERRPRSAVLCAAGPVLERVAHLTNAGWTLDGEQIGELYGLDQGLLLNDFEAAALSLAVVAPGDVAPIGPRIEPGHGAKVILGPGTGLGVAALVRCGERFMALAGEAGHISFGPADEEDFSFWDRLERTAGRVTPETVLCGPGLVRLHRALAPRFGRGAIEEEPPLIVARADGCEHCAASVRIFLKLLARFAGDMGITFGATGGVYLRGGVMNSLAGILDPQRFHAGFCDREPVAELARAIPIYHLLDDAIVMRGLAAIAAEPGRFAIDYPNRLWRP